MTTATLSVNVAGTEMHNPPNFRVVEFGTSKATWRHDESDPSALVHGTTRIASTLTNFQRLVTVRIKGADTAGLKANIAAVIAAFYHKDYEVIITWNSIVLQDWKICSPADFEIESGGMYNKFGLMSDEQQYKFTFDSSPI